ncbi:MAG: hypothetical protein R2762_00670 [Bryobacteraceae bacterium]
MQLFERAMGAFHKRNFKEAGALFAQAATGPEVDMAHTASTHKLMCERRLDTAEPVLESPEDAYTYGVSLMNQGSLDEAETVLRQALQQDEAAGHVHYALAICTGQRGNPAAAARHLRRAIELAPENRTAARNDHEFQSLARIPEIREVLGL